MFIGICCTLHLAYLLGITFTLWPFRKLGTIGFITAKIITCQEGVCWKLKMHRRKTSSMHASTFLVKLALFYMSALEEPDPDIGAAASRAVEAGAFSLQSNVHPGSYGTYHSTSFQPRWEPSPGGVEDFWAPFRGDPASNPAHMRC